MKVIKINTPDGQYTLPLLSVAKHRAHEYHSEELSKEFIEECDYVLCDDYEGIDWLLNNTDYEDWEDQTTKINSDVKVTMEDFWSRTEDFEIIDI